MAQNIGVLQVDTTIARPADPVSGYTKAQRDALTNETLIKVRKEATKCNLVTKISKGLQVSSYNPADMKDPNNFFNFVSHWESVILSIKNHLDTFYMGSAFQLLRNDLVPPSSDEIARYNVELGIFLTRSAANGGNAQQYTFTPQNQQNAVTVNRPDIPEGQSNVVDHGNLLNDWHDRRLIDVLHSVELQLLYVADATHRQNLTWSYEYMMDCLDSDLKAFVLSKISNYDPAQARTGPVVFMIVAQRIIQTTENLAQKVINGFIVLRLTHFASENVIECIFTLRNLLKFLRYGSPGSFAPRTTIVMLFDVFRGSTVGVFRNYVQQAQDIVLKDETDVEKIFDHFQSKYEELLLADRWVPTKKKPSAFTVGDINPKTYADHESERKKKDDDTPPKGERKTHDKSGRKIDYTPPKQGESHKRKRDDGVWEYWCGKCKRWGSHATSGHDEWKAKMKENYKKRKESKKSNGDNDRANGEANAAQTSTRNTPRTNGAVTFVSALTGNYCLAVDPELADGIDL